MWQKFGSRADLSILCSWMRKYSLFPGMVRGLQASVWDVGGFHGVLQAAKSFSRRPAFREPVMEKLTFTTRGRWSHRGEQLRGDIMNDQEDSEENKTELLKMIITIFEIIFKNLSGGTEIVNLIPLKRELLEVWRNYWEHTEIDGKCGRKFKKEHRKRSYMKYLSDSRKRVSRVKPFEEIIAENFPERWSKWIYRFYR